MSATNPPAEPTPAIHYSDELEFVVISDGMAKFRKGDVLTASAIREATGGGADFDRLCSIKALRLATENERGKKHVELYEQKTKSTEDILAQKDKQIATLSSRVATLEEQLTTGVHLAHQGRELAQQSSLIQEKDVAIRNLESRFQVQTQELESVRKAFTAAEAEARAAKTKLADAKLAEAAASKARKNQHESDKPAVTTAGAADAAGGASAGVK